MVNDYKAKIIKIKNLSKTVKHFVLNLSEALRKDGVVQDEQESANFKFIAGQFVNLSFEKNGEIFRRAYSIASNQNDSNIIELCIKLVENGKLTSELWKFKEGDFVNIKGPLGMFNINKATKNKLVFIGTGTGIAPLRAMIFDEISKQNKMLDGDNHEGVADSKEIILVHGVRFEDELLYQEEFEYLERENGNFKYIPVVSKPSENWTQRTNHVQDNLEFIDIFNSDFFICGLPEMFEQVKNKLEQSGVLPENIFHEVFR